MRNKRVILDTNLWISFLISKRLAFLDDFIFNGKIKLVFSNELIEEFIKVAKRPKFKKYFSDEMISDLLRLFDNYGIIVEVTSEIKKCRDPKDNFLLNLAIDSKAHYLVSGDTDLLVIKKIKKTKILSWNDFIQEVS